MRRRRTLPRFHRSQLTLLLILLPFLTLWTLFYFLPPNTEGDPLLKSGGDTHGATGGTEKDQDNKDGEGNEKGDKVVVPFPDKVDSVALSLLDNTSFSLATQRVLSSTRLLGDEMDVHLFVLWHSAFKRRRDILKDMTSNFVVLRLAEFDWGTPSSQINGLWVLYGGKGGWVREGMNRKLRQCGAGRFLALVVADMAPRYEQLATAHGPDIVNVRMHAAKTRYRKWSGGGFRVHGTFTAHEANHDVRVLFHTTPIALLRSVFDERQGKGAETESVVESYLRDDVPFRTQQPALGLHLKSGGWQCAELLLALGAFQRVSLEEMETDTLLWMRHSSPPGVPLSVTEETHVRCGDWPETLRLRVEATDVWAAVALLHAAPKSKSEKVTVESEYTVEIEKRTRSLRIIAEK